ncbi:DUF6957 family protein [Pseudomonas aeruginosa]
MFLKDLSELLYGGVPMPGLEMSNEEAVQILRKRFSWFEYCIVRDWIWCDLDVTPEQKAHLALTQCQPVILMAHTVIYDSARRFDVGDFVRTSPLYKFEHGLIFATLNSAYLLLGDGTRKRASLNAVANIF